MGRRTRDRRTFLRWTALAGAALVAGCSADGDDGTTATNEAGTEGSTSTTADRSQTGTTATDDAAETTTTRESATPTPDGDTETLSESEVVDLSGPPCEAVAGATFESVETRAGGLGDEGTPVSVHWVVRFEDDEYHYSHGDVIESGEYTCTAGDGTATIEATTGTDLTYSGRYDHESGVLVWDDVRYRSVERS